MSDNQQKRNERNKEVTEFIEGGHIAKLEDPNDYDLPEFFVAACNKFREFRKENYEQPLQFTYRRLYFFNPKDWVSLHFSVKNL